MITLENNFTEIPFTYTLSGSQLTINEEGEYNDIPERCPECNCVQVENWLPYSCKTIQQCDQCSTKIFISAI